MISIPLLPWIQFPDWMTGWLDDFEKWSPFHFLHLIFNLLSHHLGLGVISWFYSTVWSNQESRHEFSRFHCIISIEICVLSLFPPSPSLSIAWLDVSAAVNSVAVLSSPLLSLFEVRGREKCVRLLLLALLEADKKKKKWRKRKSRPRSRYRSRVKWKLLHTSRGIHVRPAINIFDETWLTSFSSTKVNSLIPLLDSLIWANDTKSPKSLKKRTKVFC